MVCWWVNWHTTKSMKRSTTPFKGWMQFWFESKRNSSLTHSGWAQSSCDERTCNKTTINKTMQQCKDSKTCNSARLRVGGVYQPTQLKPIWGDNFHHSPHTNKVAIPSFLHTPPVRINIKWSTGRWDIWTNYLPGNCPAFLPRWTVGMKVPKHFCLGMRTWFPTSTGMF